MVNVNAWCLGIATVGKVSLSFAVSGVVELTASIVTAEPTTGLDKVVFELVLTVGHHPFGLAWDHQVA
jgi:hypothetical protein